MTTVIIQKGFQIFSEKIPRLFCKTSSVFLPASLKSSGHSGRKHTYPCYDPVHDLSLEHKLCCSIADLITVIKQYICNTKQLPALG